MEEIKIELLFFDESFPILALTNKFSVLSTLGAIRTHGLKRDYLSKENSIITNTFTNKTFDLNNYSNIQITREQVEGFYVDEEKTDHVYIGKIIKIFFVNSCESQLIHPKFLVNSYGKGLKDLLKFIK